MLSLSRFKDKLYYGWVVVATCLIIGAILLGIRSSFGVFFKSIESEFNLTRTATSGIFSLNAVLSSVFAILGGWASDRYGPRIIILLMGLFTGLSLLLTSQTNSSWQLYITYSLLLSIGTGAIYVVRMATVSRWFDKKRGLAIGITSSSYGLGQAGLAPFATFLISEFDWRIAYIVIGLIAWLIVIPLSRLLKRDPQEIGAFPDGESSHLEDTKNETGNIKQIDFSLSQVLKTRSFWLIILMWLFFGFNHSLILIHLVPHVTDMGFLGAEAAIVLSLMGVMSITGGVLMGRVSDSIGRKATIIICSLLQAGAMVWLIWAQDLWMIYLFAVISGFTNGGISSPATALIGDTYGLRNIGAIMGILTIGSAIGAAIGPIIGGLSFDVSNSYSIAFLTGAVTVLIATLLVAFVRKETNEIEQISQIEGF